jgi:hypothetical protein
LRTRIVAAGPERGESDESKREKEAERDGEKRTRSMYRGNRLTPVGTYGLVGKELTLWGVGFTASSTVTDRWRRRRLSGTVDSDRSVASTATVVPPRKRL